MLRRCVVEVLVLIGLCSAVACSDRSTTGDEGSGSSDATTGDLPGADGDVTGDDGDTGDGGGAGTGVPGGSTEDTDASDDTGSLERQFCEALWECSMIGGGYSVQDCTDILGACTDGLLAPAKTDWDNAVEACLGLPLCESFGECALGIDPCGIPGIDPDTDTGTDTSGGECVPTGDVCETNGDCCDFPDSALCVNFGDHGVRCAAVCEVNGDCASDCCIPLESGESVCGPAEFC